MLTERKKALNLYNIPFCFIWKSQGVSFIQATQELKTNFKMIDNYKIEQNFNCHFKYELIPNKIESHLTSSIVYDLETQSTD